MMNAHSRRSLTWSGRLLAALFTAALLAGLAAAPSYAAEDDESALVEDPSGKPVMWHVDDDGEWFWEIEVVQKGAYIASWERDEGVWASSEEAFSGFDAALACQNEVWRDFLAEFSSYEEMFASGRAKHLTETTWQPLDENVIARSAACEMDAWDWIQTPSSEPDDEGLMRVRIPFDKIGPGTHDLFLLPLETAEVGPERTWPGGAWAKYYLTKYAAGDVSTRTVVVPSLPTLTNPNQHLLGSSVPEGSWFEPSVFGGLQPLAWTQPEAVTPPEAVMPSSEEESPADSETTADPEGVDKKEPVDPEEAEERRAAATAANAVSAPVAFTDLDSWWAPKIPPHMLAALLAGLALALLIAVPSAILERRAKKSTSAPADAVRATFFPLAQRRPEQQVQPTIVSRTPDQDDTVPRTASYTTGSTFGADQTPPTRLETDGQPGDSETTAFGSDQATHLAGSSENHADDAEGENR